jgi:simple sugar transport system permease protein
MKTLKSLGLTRLLIIAFLLVLLTLAQMTGMPVPSLVSDSLVRAGMNLLLVLSLVPTIRAGLGLNFGLPIGVVTGLFGCVMAIELRVSGLAGMMLAMIIAIPMAALAGSGYAWVLERVKGQEMMVGTYVGFSVVAMMCMVWLLLPLGNPEMVWAIGGQGLRTTISLASSFGGALDGLLLLETGDVKAPLGLFLFAGAWCAAMAFHSRSVRGLAILAAGQNPAFARSLGLDIRAQRAEATIVSTVTAAVGIVVYAQSFGFLQLYLAPLMMAFPAVASILIGGATVRRAGVSHAVVGTVLFQTLLTITLPVTQRLIEGNISEVARVIVSNGMILYALTRAQEE